MTMDKSISLPSTGFNFENCQRNTWLTHKGYPVPKARKTGTTIAGVVFKDGVVLGADTRATVGSIVSDKNCSKIHYLAPNMYCCGAGTAADTEQVTRMVASQLELHRLSIDRVVPVKVAERLITQHLFRYQGHIGAALIIGGVDFHGPTICSVSPWGCSDFVPYATMGSGSLAAMATFEKGWKENMTLEEAKQLVRDAIAGGIFNDLGSGSNIDLTVITREGAQFLRPYDVANIKGERQQRYAYAPGTTAVLASNTVKLDVVETIVRPRVADDAMDVA